MTFKRLITIAVSLIAVLTIIFSAAVSVNAADKTYIYGDADGNGTVNINDVTFIQKVLVDAATPGEDYNISSDVNYDLKVTIRDASVIQMYLAGIITKFPVTNYVDEHYFGHTIYQP